MVSCGQAVDIFLLILWPGPDCLANSCCSGELESMLWLSPLLPVTDICSGVSLVLI